jgi:phosphatidylinositol kinase/protein kinase (PI-3  family)
MLESHFKLLVYLLGNGAVEHPMLLKHGEDVRQDERIVQLLSNIDLALQRDTDCRKRRLRIRTFQVIPLSPTCGMFEWVPDTVTLKSFIETDLVLRAHQEKYFKLLKSLQFPSL